MSRTRRVAILLALWLGAMPLAAADSNSVADDEKTLKEAHQDTAGPALLEFLRKRTLGPSDRERLSTLINQLGNDSFDVREKASADLVAMGSVAVSALDNATRHTDPEVARRAQECLKQLNQGESNRLAAAVLRVVAARKPTGAVDVVLAYLPQAEEDGIGEDAVTALSALALNSGKADAKLLEALADKNPQKRAGAAQALCRAGAKESYPRIRELLQDADSSVRLKAGLCLARVREKASMPALIELLGARPYEETWPIEDLLVRLAENKGPGVSLGSDESSRRQCRDAWAAWWAKNAASIDMAKLDSDPPPLHYTLVVLLDAGKIIDLDEKNKPRFTLDGLEFPLDAQALPGDRVLVCEHNGNCVTERNRKNEVQWKQEVQEPIMAQRLPNGNTFIASRTQLIEVTREHKNVFSYARPDGDMFMKAIKLRNGDVAFVVNQGKFIRMNTKGEELTTFGVALSTFGGRLEVLPNNHVVVPLLNEGKVVELDAKGSRVWETAFDQPVAASRTSNGHTLLTSMNQNRVIEVDRNGKPVWEFKAESRITRAFRR